MRYFLEPFLSPYGPANNYGNPYNGSAEENFGRILDRGMREFRDEMCISTKAGYEMWAGPYGDRKVTGEKSI